MSVSLKKCLAMGVIIMSWVCLFWAFASDAKAAGLMTPKGGSQPNLEIQDHGVKVIVQDDYAVTTIEQVFHNPHSQDFEAIYSFPVPDQAAVSEFTYWVDGQPIIGEVMAKKEARRIYEEERAAGRETAIAEQDGYKTFTMNVFPVRAGKDVRVRMSYIQAVKADTGIGRFVYPLEDGGVDEEQMAFWTANDEVKGRFSFDLLLRSSVPVEAVRLPAHPQAQITRTSGGDWQVHIDNGEQAPVVQNDANAVMEEGASVAPVVQAGSQTTRLDSDVVVYWRHKADLAGNVDVTTYREPGTKTGTFMMVVTPGDDLQPVSDGRDWVFILDKSGSMQGKWASLTDGVNAGLRKLATNDRFRIVMFDEHSFELTRGYTSASSQNIQQAVQGLAAVLPGNSTNLYAGMELGFRGLDNDRPTGVILVTDGVTNTGETRKRAFMDLAEKADVRLFTTIMGNSANTPLLKNIAKASGGAAVAISNSDDLAGQVLAATSKLTHEAFHDVEVTINGVKTMDLWPKDLGSVYRGQQLVVFGHYHGDGVADVRVRAKVSGLPVEYSTKVTFPEQTTLNPEIERLWAYSAIEDLMWEIDTYGENADRKQAATDLAVEYGLVTPYTSMIVVREEVFAQHGIDRNNKVRIEIEQQAQQQRAGATTQPYQPNTLNGSGFQSQPQPSLSGGGSGSGALDVWALAGVLALGGLVFAQRRQRMGKGDAQ